MITIDSQNSRFLLTAAEMSYAIGIEEGQAYHLYWGPRLDRLEDLPSVYDLVCQKGRHWRQCETMCREYPVFYGEYYNEPAFKANFADGVRGSLLVYRDFRVTQEKDAECLSLFFDVEGEPFRLTLTYRVWKELPLIDRWATFCNTGTEPVTLDSFASAAWHLPQFVKNWRLTHLSGHWGKEAQIQRMMLQQGKFVMETRTGLSGPFAVPYFALDEGRTTELEGPLYFGTLQWSGNWRIVAERDGFEHTCVIGGIQEYDNALTLKPGEEFETPVFTAGFTQDGFSGASRILHRLEMEHIMPQAMAEKPMPVIVNSWGSLSVNVNEENLLGIAEKAKEIGAELFVVDDGWQKALGDWEPDESKFPNGLKAVIDKVKAMGLRFGLWVEIEACEYRSRIYQQHPEWVMRYPGREPFTRYRPDVDRTSVLLNYALPEVAEHFYQVLRRLIRETGITFLKLDMNTFFTSPGWGELPKARQGRLWIDYVRNLQNIFRRLNQEFPEVLMENCASGAGRSDFGMMHFFGRMNRSDNQDAHDAVLLHEGYTYLHAPRLAGGGCHISDSMKEINHRQPPLGFQAVCGMLGSLACGKNLKACPQEEIEAIRSYVELYKSLRPVLHFGDFYRLASPQDNPYAVYSYVSKDKKEAVVIALGFGGSYGDKIPFIRIPGLKQEAVYDVTSHFNQILPGRSASVLEYRPISGQGLATIGVRVELLGDFDYRVLHLRCRE